MDEAWLIHRQLFALPFANFLQEQFPLWFFELDEHLCLFLGFGQTAAHHRRCLHVEMGETDSGGGGGSGLGQWSFQRLGEFWGREKPGSKMVLAGLFP